MLQANFIKASCHPTQEHRSAQECLSEPECTNAGTAAELLQLRLPAESSEVVRRCSNPEVVRGILHLQNRVCAWSYPSQSWLSVTMLATMGAGARAGQFKQGNIHARRYPYSCTAGVGRDKHRQSGTKLWSRQGLWLYIWPRPDQGCRTHAC